MMPYTFNEIMQEAGHYRPNTIKAYDNRSYEYWCREMYARVISVFTIENFPDEWLRYKTSFWQQLIAFGYLPCFELPELGKLFHCGALSGINAFRMPTEVIAAVEGVARTPKLIIGENVELIRITPDFCGLASTISYYAEKLAILDGAINTSITNSKIPFILGAKNKAAAETLKVLLDEINAGNPAAFFRYVADQGKTNSDADPFHHFKLFEGTDYITDKLLQDHASILSAFDNEIGIGTLPYQKKERLVSDEATARLQEAEGKAKVSIDCLNDSLKLVNNLLGFNMTAKYSYEKEVEANEENDTI